MTDLTPHQQKIVGRYYDRRDEIMLAKLGELVTELCLVDSERKRDRLWSRVEHAMTNLRVPPGIANHILTRRDPAILSRNLRGWLKAAP